MGYFFTKNILKLKFYVILHLVNYTREKKWIFFDVINNRKTTREFSDKDVDFEIIKKILDAGK